MLSLLPALSVALTNWCYLNFPIVFMEGTMGSGFLCLFRVFSPPMGPVAWNFLKVIKHSPSSIIESSEAVIVCDGAYGSLKGTVPFKEQLKIKIFLRTSHFIPISHSNFFKHFNTILVLVSGPLALMYSAWLLTHNDRHIDQDIVSMILMTTLDKKYCLLLVS